MQHVVVVMTAGPFYPWGIHGVGALNHIGRQKGKSANKARPIIFALQSEKERKLELMRYITLCTYGKEQLKKTKHMAVTQTTALHIRYKQMEE